MSAPGLAFLLTMLHSSCPRSLCLGNKSSVLRGAVKYYFANFVRKGGGTPQIRNPLFAEKKIRNLFFVPKSGVFFLAKKNLALF